MSEDMDMLSFKEVFLAESREHLQSLNEALLKLEKDPHDTKGIDQIFRVAHTFKGMAATMGYQKITALSHRMEDYLENFRKGKVLMKGDSIDLLFECFDALGSLVKAIETGQNDAADIEKILSRLALPVAGSPGSATTTDGMESRQQGAETSRASSSTAADVARQSIRVNVANLDTLMDLTGEMVINKARLEGLGTKYRIGELQDALAHFSQISTQLQEAVLKTRMVPISYIFERFPRMVRDLAKKLKKEVDFLVMGTDIEIDRLLLEEINEPLVHLLRNALDHGLETTEERVACGKNPRGTLSLSARREKEMVVIEVADDGRGMDPKEIKLHAIERGVITLQQAGELPEAECLYLICHPRFSTAKEVSDISGRGVGLDVVKVTVEAFNGRVEIKSSKGQGSTFALKLPLSLAIAPALLVKVKHETYALPLSHIREIVAVSHDEIHMVGNREVMILRGSVLPLTHLDKVLNVKPVRKAISNGLNGESPQARYLFVVVTELESRTVGFVVSDFLGRREIVVKSLTGILRSARGFTGATILGDGSVVPILDIAAWV